MWRSKISINNLIKDKDSIKIDFLPPGIGVYSGYYITFDEKFETSHKIMEAVKSNEFVEYVKSLKKYKSGGYYTFTTKHLEKYLNWKLSQYGKTISNTTEQGTNRADD